MLKNILDLDGTKQLSNVEQKRINGGTPPWCGYCQCEYDLVYACGYSKSVACASACIG